MLTLIFGGEGVVGVNQKLTNGFSDTESPYNDGFKKLIIKNK